MTVETKSQTVGNYELLDKIADGGMGTVYKARHRQSGQRVAIKILAPHMAGNKVLVKRFEQEYQAARTLQHENIVRALDFGYHEGMPYLVMELVEGESLGQRLQRVGRLSEIDAIRIIGMVARGLHKAHRRGLIHRDVKPDNILITQDGHVKLIDMGLVKEMDTDNNLTRTGRGLGTPHFMAPEQFRNAKKADPRCDIYSLGATLYMMVTGELPFKGCGPLDAWMKKINNELTLPRQCVPTLSERIDWAVRRAMSNDPEQRPRTCREFVEDLTGHSTRRVNLPGSETNDYWFIVYHDEDNAQHTAKGTTSGIRRSLKEGLLGDASNIRTSRIQTGPFLSLRQYPEFRDLVVPVEPTSAKTTATPLPAMLKPTTRPPLPKPQLPTIKLDTMIATEPYPELALETAAPAPQIHLQQVPATGDYPKWGALLVFAGIAGALGFFLMRLLNGFHLF